VTPGCFKLIAIPCTLAVPTHLKFYSMMEWGNGHEDKFEIAQVLRLARLPSQSVVRMDSLVISAILMPSFPAHVLSKDKVEESLDMDMKIQMKHMYETYKQRLHLGGVAWYMTITSDLTTKMWNTFEILRGGGRNREKLLWYVKVLTRISFL
jgi:hypothetical protein